MNTMLYPLPDSIEVSGKKYPVKTSFRAWIEFEHILDEPVDFTKKIVPLICAVMDTKELPEDISELMTGLFDFYIGTQKSEKKAKGTGEKAVRSYSYYYDFDYIYAAFLAQYGIDLAECDMHWHKFTTLFANLNEEHRISKIMEYRAYDLNKEENKKMRHFYRRMKDLYALPDNRTQEEIDRDMSDELSKLM